MATRKSTKTPKSTKVSKPDITVFSDADLQAETTRREAEKATKLEAEAAAMRTEKEKRMQLAYAEITKKTDAAKALITEAEQIANEAGVIFGFSVAYGMGGSYYPRKSKIVDPEDRDNWWSSNEGWMSSTSQC